MAALDEVAELVRRETGIVLPPSRETALRLALRQAAPDLDTKGFLRQAADPVRGPALVERLVDEVTTQETAFARDPGQLAEIDWHALLGQAREAGDLVIRVWSAGCATGEEAYTLAILAAEAFGPGPAPVDILGTDISAAAIAAARSGWYRPNAVRGLPPALRQRYLAPGGHGGYRISDRLRPLVRFRRHNLVTEPIPPPGEYPFGLIVCRNVLIYFDPPPARGLISAFEKALRPGGSLMLGAVDALCREGPPPSAPASGPLRGATADGEPARPRRERLAVAMAAADRGDPEVAQAQIAQLLAADPLDAEAHFVRGLVRLADGDPDAAVDSLRRALYSDSGFALAAFELGRAYDLLGDTTAARLAYRRALRTLDTDSDRDEFMLRQVDIGDIAAACRTRLGEQS